MSIHEKQERDIFLRITEQVIEKMEQEWETNFADHFEFYSNALYQLVKILQPDDEELAKHMRELKSIELLDGLGNVNSVCVSDKKILSLQPFLN